MQKRLAILQVIGEQWAAGGMGRNTALDLGRAMEGRVSWNIEKRLRDMNLRQARAMVRRLNAERRTGSYNEVHDWLYANYNQPLPEGAV